ncbi:MAG: Asp-tRNA(Asn)/Glu-tRNA(Gln) amidotransferase subunit GatA [Acidobacteria bacterium]|nr:MAG: Asp-tRNA(Asn)/Glu-tRNA(Gln) amidotransferase subunit GatA [Acidobacteriota bacterium]
MKPRSAPSAAEIARKVRGRTLTAEEAVADALSRLDAAAPLNAVVHRNDEAVLARARRVDAAIRRGAPPGPLAGVPVAVKDNICTRDLPTTCASRILAGYVSPFAATAVRRLERAGAIVVAKTNCDEFAMGASTETSRFGPTRNPRDPRLTPGGSSGGSAAIVAAGAVPIALGSDTGGSVRQPAAFCGVFGLKPTYGRISRWGLVAFASSMDQIGPIARNATDLALALQAMAGHDARDATSSRKPVPDWTGSLDGGVRALSVGRLEVSGVDPAVREAVEWAAEALAGAGAKVTPATLDGYEGALAVYHVVAAAEASSNLARFDGVRYGFRAAGPSGWRETIETTRGEGFGMEVKRRLMLGTLALASGRVEERYGRAIRAREALRRILDRRLGDCDLLLGPVSDGPAFPRGERHDPMALYACDRHTVWANLGGHPAVAVPTPVAAGAAPIGVQLLARRFDETSLLRAARVLESAAAGCA